MNRTNVIEDLTLLPLPPWWLIPWVIAIAVLLLALLAAGVVLLARLRPRPQPASAVPDGPPPDAEFLRRLAALRARRASLEAYPLAIEVSEILRGYLDARYRFHILYQTTREFLGAAVGRPELTEPRRQVLALFLGLCDDVKFARRPATVPEQDALLDTAEAFIRASAAPSTAP